jgi:hypothetical protein
MTDSFALSFAAIDILLERLELGSPPFPFEIPHHGQTYDERAGIRSAVLADLGRRNLLEDAEVAVRQFANPEIVITLFGRLDKSSPLFARVCCTGQHALRAVADGQRVQFGRIRPTAVVSSAVELLPDERAGIGQPVIIPQGARPEPVETGGIRQNVRGPVGSGPSAQLQKAQLLLRQEKIRLGQFRVTVKGRHGREDHAPDLFWFDTPTGRYTVNASTGRDGQQWTTFSPVDSGRINQLLSMQLATLLGAR